MKKIKYISLLLASLFIYTNAYAQKAKSAEAIDDIFAKPSVDQGMNNKDAQANALNRIEELKAGDLLRVYITTANYSFAKGTVSICAKNTEDGIAHRIEAEFDESSQVKAKDFTKSLSGLIDRATEYNEDAMATKVALLALSESMEGLTLKGDLPNELKGNFEAGIVVSSVKEGSFIANLNISSANSTINAVLDISKLKSGSYKVSGKIGDVSLVLKLSKTIDSYILTGELAGEEVKSTISRNIDLLYRLDSSAVLTENGNGTQVNLREAINNLDNTHTVIETIQSGEVFTDKYKGNTLVPYEEYRTLNEAPTKVEQ